MKMVDRVAAVLLGRVNAPEQEIYAAARAAIEALMTPTPEMVEAGDQSMWPGVWEDDGGEAVRDLTAAYQAMIRAAMEE